MSAAARWLPAAATRSARSGPSCRYGPRRNAAVVPVAEMGCRMDWHEPPSASSCPRQSATAWFSAAVMSDQADAAARPHEADAVQHRLGQVLSDIGNVQENHIGMSKDAYCSTFARLVPGSPHLLLPRILRLLVRSHRLFQSFAEAGGGLDIGPVGGRLGRRGQERQLSLGDHF